MNWRMKALGACAVLLLVAAGCGDDDDTTDATGGDDVVDDGGSDDTSGDDAAGDDGAGEDAGDDGATSDGAGSGGGGTLVLGDETIPLDSARCFLQEQDAAAGGGKILLTGQGMGVNAEGEEVLVDFTRWDEDSDFTGDDILVDIGDPFSGDTESYSFTGDIGAVSVDGSTISASGITFVNFDNDPPETVGSVVINC